MLQGHFGGELWGLATNPTNSTIATAGGDKYVRLWDIEKK